MMTRHSISRLLRQALLVAVTIGLGPSSHLWSQTSVPPVSDNEPTVVLPSPAPTAATSMTMPVHADPLRGPCEKNYWIVSSRNCAENAENCLPCHYNVFRCDGSNCARNSSLDELLASLQPGVPICFMAHGSFVEWDSMRVDSAHTYQWLRCAAPHLPVHIIFFTWPSDTTCRIIPQCDVNKMGHRATLHGLYLADIVKRVPAESPVCLIGHSHGARLVCGSVQALAGGEVEGKVLTDGADQRHRIRIVLAAAAMDHNWLNPGEYFDRVLSRAEAALNLRNKIDVPLLVYPIRRPFAGRALAISGLTWRDKRKLGCEAFRLDECDVSTVVRCGHIWKHYYNEPDVACAIRNYVYFDESR